ncbi:MAG: phage tail protein [Gammaproteobacteria bacterium]|nr:MAG: phage tail protein [Gammaproteobacteria bacterium]
MANNRAQLLITAVDQTRGAFDSIKRNLGDLGNAARSINGLLGTLGLAVSAAGLGAMVKASLDSADSLSKLSQRVGITVESLSTLIPVADLAGVSGEKFEGGLRKLATRMLDAATGSDEAARGFAAVGVSIQNQDGTLRATDQVLLDLTDRFKAMPDGAQKTALAVDLFGKSGADLIPFLNQGRDGVEALTTELQALGVQIGGDTAAQAEVFNDSLAKVRLAITSIGNRVIEAFLPAMNDMANGMVESAKQGGSLRAILDGVVLVLKTLALGAATVGKAFVALGEAIGAGMAAAVEALSGNVSGAKAIITELKGSLVQRLDELAEFRDSLFDPKPVEVRAPAIVADPSLIDRLRTPGRSTGDNGAARLALAKAQADAELKLLKDVLDRQSRSLDEALDGRLISLADYYAAKTALETREIDAEIARTQTLLAEQKRIAASGADEGARIKARAEVAKIEADLIVLNNKRADVEVANARKAADAERSLRDELARVREELLDLTGAATGQDRRAAVERQYQSLIERLRAEGDTEGVATVAGLIDVKVAAADLATYERQFNDALSRMRATEESINLQRQSGLLTESQARAQILALHRETGATLESLLPQLEASATAIGPDALARVQAWKNEIAQVKLVVDDVAVAIDGAVQDGFAQMFEAIGSGAKSAKDAFADFARSVLAAINRIASQKLAESLFGSLFGGGGTGGTGGFGALVSSFFKGFATGGYVTGPGTSTSDSIPARLSAGEYVVNAAAVKRVGVAFLQSINGISAGPRVSGPTLAFAAGGLVPEAAQAQAPGQSVRIVNVIDPAMAADYLNSSSGEKTILNILQRNAGAVRQVLS